MHRWPPLLVPALALAAAALAPTDAEAKGLVLITHGTAVMHYETLTGDARARAAEATRYEVDVGYTYSHFGVFWLDLWTWGGGYCLYQGDNVWELTPEETADLLGVAVDDLGKPFLYRIPLGLLILVLGAAGLGVWARYAREEGPGIPQGPARAPADPDPPPPPAPSE